MKCHSSNRKSMIALSCKRQTNCLATPVPRRGRQTWRRPAEVPSPALHLPSCIPPAHHHPSAAFLRTAPESRGCQIRSFFLPAWIFVWITLLSVTARPVAASFVQPPAKETFRPEFFFFLSSLWTLFCRTFGCLCLVFFPFFFPLVSTFCYPLLSSLRPFSRLLSWSVFWVLRTTLFCFD